MPKKLPRADRRAQLLDVAHTIVREQGTDALTLGALAEHAGVSKPITYNHFETRAGLMIALYQEIMDRQVRALAAAIEDTPKQMAAVSHVLADAYMDCYRAVGPEWHAIGAALRGDAQMDAAQRQMIDGHIAFFAKVLTPLSKLSPEMTRRRCIGIIGAGEALSDAMVRGEISRDCAVMDFTDLITSWLTSNSSAS